MNIKQKLKSIIKMGNKIRDKRAFVPHGQHLGIQVKLSIWSSTSIESCILKGWEIYFKGGGENVDDSQNLGNCDQCSW